MKLTVKKLCDLDACQEAVEEFSEQKETNLIKLIQKMIRKNDSTYLQWANWLIVRCMNYKQYVSYAIYAAKQVLNLYEKKYPKNKRPREAIKAAVKCLKNPSEKNKNAAHAAAHAAADAADAAHAAYAAYAAAHAAYAAHAADAAHAAAHAADAAHAAAHAADAARNKMKIKILRYGIKLLEVKK